jgi:membrane protein implicated in regulation of membrane protease activity
MAWLEANVYLCWFILGALFIGVEMLTGTAVIFFFGLGALAASLTALLGLSFQTQMLVFIVAACASLVLLRRRLRAWLNRSDRQVSDNYVGSRVLVTEDLQPGQIGRVNLNGAEWRATSASFIPSGGSALIEAHQGLVLVVRPLPGPEQGE